MLRLCLSAGVCTERVRQQVSGRFESFVFVVQIKMHWFGLDEEIWHTPRCNQVIDEMFKEF